jgi:hypothetical protein
MLLHLKETGKVPWNDTVLRFPWHREQLPEKNHLPLHNQSEGQKKRNQSAKQPATAGPTKLPKLNGSEHNVSVSRIWFEESNKICAMYSDCLDPHCF